MTKFKTLIVGLILFTACKIDEGGLMTITISKNGIVDNKTEIVSETIKTLRMSDRLPIAILTRVYNYNNDARLKYLTGLSKEDGLQDYLLDSIFYDKLGNDTLKRSFVCIAKKWQPTQIFKKKFGEKKQIEYYVTERSFNRANFYKREIFYKYNAEGLLISETDCEATSKTNADSISKKEYIYSATNELDKTISYSWKANKWKEIGNSSR